jgi:hypothetical protein
VSSSEPQADGSITPFPGALEKSGRSRSRTPRR